MTRLVAFVLAIAVAAAFAGAPRSTPWVIYNRSASVPIGFYVRSNGPIELGALVSVAAVTVAPDYARTRTYDDPSDRFIKRIAAVAGDHVCATGDQVVLRGELVLRRAAYDSNHEVLPAWSECRVLARARFSLRAIAKTVSTGAIGDPSRSTRLSKSGAPSTHNS